MRLTNCVIMYIPEDSISKIFEAFYRIDHSRSRKTGGSGLGSRPLRFQVWIWLEFLVPSLQARLRFQAISLKMEKVFSNLIGNAIKYSPQGASIRILAFAEHQQWVFSIENTGTHIPEDSISKIFEAFYRIAMGKLRSWTQTANG